MYQVITRDEQMAILQQAISHQTRWGWQLVSVYENQAVLTKQVPMGWFWNTVFVLMTCGLWLIYVIWRALNRKQRQLIITIDAYGINRTRRR